MQHICDVVQFVLRYTVINSDRYNNAIQIMTWLLGFIRLILGAIEMWQGNIKAPLTLHKVPVLIQQEWLFSYKDMVLALYVWDWNASTFVKARRNYMDIVQHHLVIAILLCKPMTFRGRKKYVIISPLCAIYIVMVKND